MTLQDWPANEVVHRPLAELIPYARNARTHSDAQIGQIAASIREWGWTMPILVDEAGMIIAGHARMLAAERLGIDRVPVIVARGWSEAQKRAYVVADNKLGLNAGWNEELLRIELDDLKGFGELIGFSEEELIKLLKEDKAPSEFGSYDETIETEHECPKCHYKWSGSSSAKSDD